MLSNTFGREIFYALDNIFNIFEMLVKESVLAVASSKKERISPWMRSFIVCVKLSM